MNMEVLLRRRRGCFLTLCALSLLSVMAVVWVPPPVEQHNIVASVFSKPDPNSIDGRVTVGYWDDTKPGASANDAVDENWDIKEKEMVINYLKLAFDGSNQCNEDDKDCKGPKVLTRWRGLAMCRLCDEVLGNTCHGDIKYNWPDGYLHYIEKHNVKPPQNFIDHVREQSQQHP